MKFADLITSDAADSASLRAALERAEAAAKDAAGGIERLTADRADALVRDDEKALDKAEVAIGKLRRDLDRADLAAAELEKRLTAAEEAERVAEVDAIHRAGVEAQDTALALIKGRYVKAAAALVKVANELDDAETAITAANEALKTAGDPRRIESADVVARPRHPAQPFATSILRGLEIPDPGQAGATIWPSMPLASAVSVAP